jgi:hypothetical protein
VFPTTENAANGPAPDGDLNPLSNPLLAANLVRWAEVYFASPPERRAHAVAVLLQELETVACGNPEILDSEVADEKASTLTAPLEQTSSTSQAADAPITDNGVLCTGCGHLNLDEQSFCGMCGIPLASTLHATQHQQLEPSARIAEEQNIHGIFGPYYADHTGEPEAALDALADEDNTMSDPTTLRVEDSGLPSFARAADPAPYRYRLYVGIVVAVLLGGLMYLGRRGDVFSDGQRSPDSRVIPPAQPGPAAQASQGADGNSPLPTEKPKEKESQARSDPDAESQTKAKALQRQPPPTPSPQSALVSAKHAASSPQPATPQSQSADKDLAEAETYLNGTRHIRDTREALPLLWDAVAKGNAPATLALSDLYLRGDGVAQNCAQARLLLDVAAKKGVKGAGERLQHLPAFGCR